MSKLVRIPESALAELLRAAGRTESVADYLASAELREAQRAGDLLQRRANAAWWSRYWLLASAVLSGLGLLGGLDLEDLIATVLLGGMTVVEFRVCRLFQEGSRQGATLGWWNQCLFSALFLVYGLYHATFVTVPAELNGLVDPSFNTVIVGVTRVTYGVIGAVGGIGQFCLACYYRGALR